MAGTRPLREVVTRFRFEQNEGDIRKFNSNMSGMKSTLRGVGAVFGTLLGGAGAMAIGKMGMNMERAEVQLKRLAGTDFNKFRGVLSDVTKQINTIRAGASGIFNQRQFDVAAANFARVFGTGEKEMQAFGKIFEFSAKQAILTGQNVEDISKTIQDAVAGGGFEGLLDIPGFTQFKKQILEFQQQVMDPGEPGGAIGMQNRMRAITQIISQATAQQDKDIQKVPDSLLKADIAGNKLQDTLQRLGDTLMNSLVPALDKLVKLLDFAMEKLGILNKESSAAGANPAAFAAGKIWSSAAGGIKDIVVGATDPNKRKAAMDSVEDSLADSGWLPPFQMGGSKQRQANKARDNLAEMNRIAAMHGGELPPAIAGRFAGKPGFDEYMQSKGMAATTINNTFNITGGSPMDIAREVQKKQEQSVDQARSSYQPSERR